MFTFHSCVSVIDAVCRVSITSNKDGVECVLLDAAGQNKQHSAAKNVAKLDRETEELHHDTVGLDLARLIQQGRQAKSMTQKELATVRTSGLASTQ